MRSLSILCWVHSLHFHTSNFLRHFMQNWSRELVSVRILSHGIQCDYPLAWCEQSVEEVIVCLLWFLWCLVDIMRICIDNSRIKITHFWWLILVHTCVWLINVEFYELVGLRHILCAIKFLFLFESMLTGFRVPIKTIKMN